MEVCDPQSTFTFRILSGSAIYSDSVTLTHRLPYLCRRMSEKAGVCESLRSVAKKHSSARAPLLNRFLFWHFASPLQLQDGWDIRAEVLTRPAELSGFLGDRRGFAFHRKG